MVRKLMKHELIALFRILVWFMGAVMLLGVIARISLESVTLIDSGSGANIGLNVGLTLSTTFSVSFWFFSIIALWYAALILSVVRYFKSLFTGEGYLTFSLPVTPTQLLLAKFFSALIASAACIAVVILSCLVMLPSTAWAGLGDVIYNLFAVIREFFASEPIVIIEVLLAIIAIIPSGLLYLYLVASIGQLFTKGRIVITIALYYAFSFALQMMFSIFIFPLIQLTLVSVHLVIWLGIIVLIAFDVASFLVIRYILLHKVNLVV